MPGTTELREQVRHLCAEWDFEPRSDAWMRSIDPGFSRELGRRGWLGLTWPRELGGGGRSQLDRLAVVEELLRAGAPVAAHWVGDRQIGPAIVRHGSPQLQAELLPGILAGESIFCLGMSEPQAGSDLASVQTTATRVEGGWRLDGRKLWTGFAHVATHAYVLARTSRSERRHRGLSELLVDMDADGVSLEPIWDLGGTHRFNDVRFDGVFVPEHRLLGTEGDGWRQVVEQLSLERGGPERFLSTYPLLAEALAEAAGSEAALEQLGSLVARLGVLRRMGVELADALDDGRAPIQEAATLKLVGTAFERAVVELGRRLLPSSPSYEPALLATPGMALRGGSEDVLLGMIAKQEAAVSDEREPPAERAAATDDDPAAPAGGDPTRASLLYASAIASTLAAVVAMTREHVAEREQFGAPLLELPAVARNLALMRVELLVAEAAARRAMDHATPEAAAGGRVVCAAAATEVARLAHLLHGALGTTREHPLHRLTRRLWAWRDAGLPAHRAAAQLGARAADEGEVALWERLAGP